MGDFESMVQKLKNKRKEIATREGKELFMILSNATIDAMAQAMPQNKGELIQVKGWGEKKIQMYGDLFLEILNSGTIQPSEKTSDEQTSLKPKRIKIQIGQESLNLFGKESPVVLRKDASPTVEIIDQQDFSSKNNTFSVSEFLGNVNTTLSTLGEVKIKGEMDDVQVRNGYAFFELKDSLGGFDPEASMGCFVGWKCFSDVKHLLESGFEVIVSGVPKIYLKNGSFRLEVTNIEAVGEGALQRAFEALQRNLQEKGYFDKERKRPIPAFVRTIGLITSFTGAAIIDFKKNLGDQGLQVQYIDVRVEGDQAEESIVQAIRQFNEQKISVDVLVLIRGGGSLQSLKAFNSERVADSVYYSRIPVITGIGHERDETIAGFVADLNCSTPTAVANFLRGEYENLENLVSKLTADLFSRTEYKIRESQIYLDHKTKDFISSFEKQFLLVRRDVDTLYERLKFGLQKIFIVFSKIEKTFLQFGNQILASLQKETYSINLFSEKIKNIFQSNFTSIQQRLNVVSEKIGALNPEAILKRGYSIAYDKNGKVLKGVENICRGDFISLRLSQGKVVTEVKSIEKE